LAGPSEKNGLALAEWLSIPGVITDVSFYSLEKASSHRRAREKSFAVIPPSTSVVRVKVTLLKRISISRCRWFLSACIAMRLTQCMLCKNPLHVTVRTSVCARFSQSGMAFKPQRSIVDPFSGSDESADQTSRTERFVNRWITSNTIPITNRIQDI
jgi:hypothetical protein